jgi:hypothetical protein
MPSSIRAMNSIKAFMGFFSFSIYLLLILETTPPFTPRAAARAEAKRSALPDSRATRRWTRTHAGRRRLPGWQRGFGPEGDLVASIASSLALLAVVTVDGLMRACLRHAGRVVGKGRQGATRVVTT